MSPNVKKGLIIAGAALLGVIALAGWTREPRLSTSPNYFNQPDSAFTQPAPVAPAPAAATTAPRAAAPAAAAPQRVAPRASTAAAPKAPVYRKRSTKESAAIIGGSAAAGAAVGALAGGGKGAAIGAIAGGGGGFVYDRMTRKKKVKE